MHVDANQIVTVVSALATIVTFIVGHILHYKKTADKIQQVANAVEQNAPQVAQVVNDVAGVAHDLSQ